MAAKLLRHMGVDKDLAGEVRRIIQEKGEVRLKAERQRKREAHLAAQAAASKKRRRNRSARAKSNPES